jgi:hypothetical protein
VISHSFAFNASRHLSILVSMLDLSPPLPVFLLLHVGGLSRLNTPAVQCNVCLVLEQLFKSIRIWKSTGFSVILSHLWCRVRSFGIATGYGLKVQASIPGMVN